MSNAIYYMSNFRNGNAKGTFINTFQTSPQVVHLRTAVSIPLPRLLNSKQPHHSPLTLMYYILSDIDFSNASSMMGLQVFWLFVHNIYCNSDVIPFSCYSRCFTKFDQFFEIHRIIYTYWDGKYQIKECNKK